MARVRFTPVGARVFLSVIAIAMATNSTLSVCAEERARRTATKTVSVTAKTHASAPSMPVAFATVRAQCTLVDARTFLRAIAIATETNRMPLECAVERVWQMPTKTAFATVKMPASVRLMPAVSATDRVRLMRVDAQEFPQVTAIAMATSSTLWACAEVRARQTWTRMAFATTWILA